MVTLVPIVPPEKADSMKNRLVEYMCKSTMTNRVFGKAPSWRGALETEYFSIVFVGGVLAVSVSEREGELGKQENTVALAESKTLRDLLDVLKGQSDEVIKTAQLGYYQNLAQKEQDEITFEDVMTLLDWKYVQFAKIDEDTVSELCP